MNGGRKGEVKICNQPICFAGQNDLRFPREYCWSWGLGQSNKWGEGCLKRMICVIHSRRSREEGETTAGGLL